MKGRTPIILLTLLASFIAPVLIGNVYATTCPPGNCQAAVSSNVPSGDGTIWVEVDNNTSNRVPLPQTFSFPYNTTHTIKVLNSTFTGSSTSGHYVWKNWSNYYGTQFSTVWTTNPMLVIGPILYNYTGTAGFTAVFDRQYAATLSFTDATGNPLSPAPAYVTLQGEATGTSTVSGYSGKYVTSDLYTVTSARWEGADIPTTTAQTIDLSTGPVTATISLKAYPATVLVVDKNNHPVSAANVTVTFVNGTITTRNYVSDSNGNVHLGDIPYPGTFGLTVSYQNREYGPYSPDAATNSTYTVQVNATSAVPPSWPSGSALTVSSVTSSSLVLSWAAASSNVGIASYRVLENGMLLATVSGNVTSFLVTGLTPGSSYAFKVEAVDRDGNVSSTDLSQTETMPVQQSTSQLWFFIAVGTAASLGLATTGLSLVLRKRQKRRSPLLYGKP